MITTKEYKKKMYKESKLKIKILIRQGFKLIMFWCVLVVSFTMYQLIILQECYKNSLLISKEIIDNTKFMIENKEEISFKNIKDEIKEVFEEIEEHKYSTDKLNTMLIDEIDLVSFDEDEEFEEYTLDFKQKQSKRRKGKKSKRKHGGRK